MRVYVSHSIRGKYGKDATHEQMEENCAAIMEIVKNLRKKFPEHDFYVPAEHEDFVQLAYDLKYLTEKEILEIDCFIIQGRDAVIVYVPEEDELQGGRLIEYEYAIRIGIPVVVYSEIESVVKWLEKK